MKDNRAFETVQVSVKDGFAKIPPRSDGNVRPGDMMGLTVDQVQQYIKRQKKAKGFSQLLTLGDNNTVDVKLPGSARVMLGFSLDGILGAGVVLNGQVTLQINNEIMIENVPVKFFSAAFTDEEYYFFPRPLSGNDDIKLFVKGVTAVYTIESIFYYL